MHKNRLIAIILLIFSSLMLFAADNPPPSTASEETQAELSSAFFSRLDSVSAKSIITFNLFTPEVDTAFISPDGKTAVIWLALRDDGGRILATEPGLVVAKITENGWQVLLPGDPGWDETIAALPEGMLPAEKSPPPDNMILDTVAELDTLTGYYLPYAAGTSRWLEGSISHFQYIPELGYPSCTIEFCHYAYDFTDDNHYPLLASKGGTVYASRDTCTDGSESCTNYIVLYNANENTYQIYLHLSNGTIPDKLTPNASVVRGQYLGDTDDTGYSTSNHVHFMVVNSIWAASGYYWGRSIDIRFADVAINNGIPRTCYEVTSFPIYDGATQCLGNRSDPRNPNNDWFPSGNVGAFPPTGALTRPVAGAIVTTGDNQIIDVTANATDDVRVAAVRMIAWINSQWVEIGPRVTSQASPGVYDWDVNLCSVGPLNGPLAVALRVWDHEGNVSVPLSQRTIQVDHACPLPTGTITSPTSGATVLSGTSPTLAVSATASDDVGVASVRLVAKMNDQWVEIGPMVTQPVQPGVYQWNVDMCAVGPLNGALEIALRVWDQSGAIASALSSRTIFIDHACPPPVSQLNPVVVNNSTAVNPVWTASNSGAGLGSFELQWRIGSGIWVSENILPFPGSQRSAWFVGQPGTTYGFRLRAFDSNGQAEAWPAGDVAETTITLPSTCNTDLSEPDDISTQAKSLAIEEEAQRNLCGAADPDWFLINITNPNYYRVSANSVSGGAAVKITVYKDDGITILASGMAPDISQAANLVFKVDVADNYYVKIEPLVANLTGTNAIYEISVSQVNINFLPLISR